MKGNRHIWRDFSAASATWFGVDLPRELRCLNQEYRLYGFGFVVPKATVKKRQELWVRTWGSWNPPAQPEWIANSIAASECSTASLPVRNKSRVTRHCHSNRNVQIRQSLIKRVRSEKQVHLVFILTQLVAVSSPLAEVLHHSLSLWASFKRISKENEGGRGQPL